jgi:hypothetical protein
VKYLNLISGPRNISTALMYSFAQRPDTIVLDEPFYAVYLSRSGVDHPGKEYVLAAQSADEQVVSGEIFKEWPRPIVFIKNMAHHIEVMENKLLDHATNIFLIRNPEQIIASYAEVIEQPIMRDIGIQYQFELFEQLRREGKDPIVIDSGLVVDSPTAVLTALCRRLRIEFMPEMLSWSAGPKPYDGVWASYWYTNVHRSTGFEKQATSSRPMPASLLPLCERARFYYEKLVEFAVRPQLEN